MIVPGTVASISTNGGGTGNIWANTTNFGRTGNSGNICMAAHQLYLGNVTNFNKVTFTITIYGFTEGDWRNYGVQYSAGGKRHSGYDESAIGTKITSGGTYSINIASLSGEAYLNVGSIFGNYMVSSVILE